MKYMFLYGCVDREAYFRKRAAILMKARVGRPAFYFDMLLFFSLHVNACLPGVQMPALCLALPEVISATPVTAFILPENRIE
jgi:hypothetical protein